MAFFQMVLQQSSNSGIGVPGPLPGSVHVPERGRRIHGHLQLSEPNIEAFGRRLGIPKLNFQVLRRTMATRAQNLGSVKDIQSHLRHSRADTTANEYMQELPESVQLMVGRSTKCSRQQQRSSRQWKFEPVQPAQLMPAGRVWHQMASSLFCQYR